MEACSESAALAEWERINGEPGRENARGRPPPPANPAAVFADAFVDALGGDFLADVDERSLRRRWAGDAAELAVRLRLNRRVLDAQQALHALYRALMSGAMLSAQEAALAEHARDLVEMSASRERERQALLGRG